MTTTAYSLPATPVTDHSTTSTPSQPASFSPNNVVLKCRACGKQTPLGPLLSFLSILKVSRDGTSLVKVESPASRGKQIAALNPCDLCLGSFHNYLRVLNERNPPNNQFKTKKVKKRGRKKWVAKHDLLLEGSILLWGDDVAKIMRLLPEFNENVIRRKLGHVLWKTYAISSTSKQTPKERPADPDTAVPSELLAEHSPTTGLTLEDKEPNDSYMVDIESDFSPEKVSESLDKVRWTAVSAFDDKPTLDGLALYPIRDTLQCPSDTTVPILDLSYFGAVRNNPTNTRDIIPSFADLTKTFMEGLRGTRDATTSPDSRRDLGFYRTSLVDVFNSEKNLE